MPLYVIAERFDSGAVAGAAVVAVAAVIAMVFVSLVLLHMLLVVAIPAYTRRMSSSQERKFLMSPLGFYIICLFISNLITAIGGVVEATWAGARSIQQGPSCTTQAFLLQLGSNATALWMGVTAISALRAFMFKARQLPRWAAFLMIFILWTGMIVFDGVASTIFADRSKQFFYGIAGIWCWITPSHTLARLLIQYVWMWVWSVVSAICFLLVFLRVRGNIAVKRDEHGRRIKWTTRSSGLPGKEEYKGLAGTVGKTMCWFSITYITLIVPMSVSRVAETFGFPVPVYAFAFSAVNFLLIGVVNSIIYMALRHSLKRTSGTNSPEATLRGSYGIDKYGTESFEAPQEKRPSPVNKATPYPWTPTPTTQPWVPPSAHRGADDPTSPQSSVVAYAMTSGEDSPSAFRTSIVSNAPPRQAPVSSKVAQRSRSFHRPMESINTVTSASTVMSPKPLPPVPEASATTGASRPQLAIPPPALIARRQSNPSPHIISPVELGKLTDIPLSPDQRLDHKRAASDMSVYSGPRAISPDLNALLEDSEPATPIVPPQSPPSGPPPPRRKAKRTPTPSVPVDVDESDQGSITVSPKPSVEQFSDQDLRPMSMGDITSRTPTKRVDSMRTFWAAYEEPSPRASKMPVPAPVDVKRDTMRTFWAAYEDPSPTTPRMPIPADGESPRRETVLEAKGWNRTRSSEDFSFKPVDPSVFLKPAISAVGRAPAPARNDSSSASVKSTTSNLSHRRSRSFTPMPSAPMIARTASPAMLRPATSAVTRYGSPGLVIRDGPSRHTPTPSDSSRTSDTSYRMPRPQPGYV